MWFAIKASFWLVILLLALPIFLNSPGTGENSTDSQPHTASETGAENLGIGSALLAAQTTIEDVKGFCERQPETCETGATLVRTLGERARDGLSLALTYLDTRLPQETGMAQDADKRAGESDRAQPMPRDVHAVGDLQDISTGSLPAARP